LGLLAVETVARIGQKRTRTGREEKKKKDMAVICAVLSRWTAHYLSLRKEKLVEKRKKGGERKRRLRVTAFKQLKTMRKGGKEGKKKGREKRRDIKHWV